MTPLPSRSIRTLLAAAVLLVAAPAAAQAAPQDLFFSEYVEGSSNNKALEIVNPTADPVDLSGVSVRMHFNGNATAGLTINLSGTVAPGDVFVLAHSSASAAVLAQADQTNASSWFNGDDAVGLFAGDTPIDVIGQIGVDPGTEWGSGLTSTADNTLRRKASVQDGDPVGSDAFDPAVEWDGFATDTFTGLGSHSQDDPPPPPAPGKSIAEIQGAGHLSPLDGTAVSDVEGVVTAVASNGFWFEDRTPDADPKTSEGLFVFTGGQPTVAVGDLVRVDGTVAEFRPGGSGGTNNLTLTELTNPTWTSCRAGTRCPRRPRRRPAR